MVTNSKPRYAYPMAEDDWPKPKFSATPVGERARNQKGADDRKNKARMLQEAARKRLKQR